MRPSQIGALPGDGRRSSRGLGFMAPRIVMTCRVGSSRRSAWASTSATASLIVSATATHPQEQDTTHGTAIVEKQDSKSSMAFAMVGPRAENGLGRAV